MRRVFLDLGAYTGDTIELALRRAAFDIIYGFEPLRENFGKLRSRYEDHPGVILINAAADESDGEATLYKGNAQFGDVGGSLYREMTTISSDSEKVRTVDFSAFVKSSFCDDDYIVLKMDIEGKEYGVLSKMIRDATISRVDELYCEWHYSALGMPADDHFAFVRRLRRLGFGLTGNKDLDEFVYVHDWSPLRLAFRRQIWWCEYCVRQWLKRWLPSSFRDVLRKLRP